MYKPPSDEATHGATHVISKSETNVTLGPGQAAQAEQLLECIGMRQLVRVEKTRVVYRHPAYREVVVAVDTVAGIGSFVEVEVISADAPEAAELVGQVEAQLDLQDCPPVDLLYRTWRSGGSRLVCEVAAWDPFGRRCVSGAWQGRIHE
ncbi:CYTH domain-containing protein [Streptantibioticus ferralitis]|uniref:CYTH domain-containing protein n=1 Tax=Streptantibioticus ferralitis TaxID=236510 RepID=UPI0031E1A9F3